MAQCAYNCDDLPAYDSALAGCTLTRSGGSSDIVFLLCGHGITDFSDGTQINAAIDAGTAKLLSNLKIGLAKGSPNTIDPVTSCGTSRVLNNTYTGTIFDAKVNETNGEYWNAVTAGYIFEGAILSNCTTEGQTDIAFVIENQISVSGSLVSPDVNTDLLRFEMDFTWTGTGAQIVAAPTGVWD